ncbi:C45 family autoproteolytic acyltransferase/hydrolase [candidate division KSB1 bacterium]
MRSLIAVCIVCAAVTLPAVSQERLTSEEQAWIDRAESYGQDGWIYLYVEGGPFERGFQNGYLLAEHVGETIEIISYYLEQTTEKEWDFFRDAAETMFWPKLDSEYRDEIDGIVAGLRKAGVTAYDRIDITAYNGWIDLAWYYLPYTKAHGSCSAFIATGNATYDGRIVVGHNLWYEYMFCRKWNVILDVNPDEGSRMITQSFPGWIFGGTDFWINSAGLIVVETTMSGFEGFEPEGVPEFQRIRKALQYGTSIDSFVEIMLDGNNGGYANDWLIGDTKTGEIARLELALKNPRVWRTFDGYYTGSNVAQDPKVRNEEARGMDYEEMSSSPNGRWARWQQLMRENYGKIDRELARRFLADHYDSFEEAYNPGSRTLCGHVEYDPLGLPEWDWGPFYPGGAIDAKVTDSEWASQMKFSAKFGHSCDIPFLAEPFLEAHPEYDWQRPYLKDFPSYPWTTFQSRDYSAMIDMIHMKSVKR